MSDLQCLSCAVVLGTKETIGGTILETPNFHAHQDVAYPIPGLVIVAAKRHIKCLDELSDVEATEFIGTVKRIRNQQRVSLGIEHVYFFYNEDTTHHFHLWLVPRAKWMQQFGRSVESLRPILLHARHHMSTPENIIEVTRSVEILRSALAACPS